MLTYFPLLATQPVDAVEKYREVLSSIEEHRGVLKTDSLQQLHAMFNLHETLQTRPPGVPPTLRDGELQKQVRLMLLFAGCDFS